MTLCRPGGIEHRTPLGSSKSLVALACCVVLAAGGCFESDNDTPRFAEGAWVEFQRRDNAFATRTSRMLYRFLTCSGHAKSDDEIEDCGFPLEQNASGLANEYTQCWDCSSGEEDIYDGITTDSPCWVELRDLYDVQQELASRLSDLGRGVGSFGGTLDRSQVLSEVDRVMGKLELKRGLARSACQPHQ